MLCLTRKAGEQVVIRFAGVEVVVEVDSVRGDKVRLNFKAPPSVSIHRREIQRAIDGADAIGAAPVDHERKRR